MPCRAGSAQNHVLNGKAEELIFYNNPFNNNAGYEKRTAGKQAAPLSDRYISRTRRMRFLTLSPPHFLTSCYVFSTPQHLNTSTIQTKSQHHNIPTSQPFFMRYSAICTALRAAPLRIWSPLSQNVSPLSSARSLRTRPTYTSSLPAVSNGIG